jgi:hypothetical protein
MTFKTSSAKNWFILGRKHLAQQLNTNKLHGLSHSKLRPKVTQFASNDPNLLCAVPLFTAKIQYNFYASEHKVIILDKEASDKIPAPKWRTYNMLFDLSHWRVLFLSLRSVCRR